MDQLLNQIPFLLRRENIAHYEQGSVLILDRRKFPFERSFIRCEDVEAVARAIEEMVTQGGGPGIAAAYALVMEAERLKHLPPEKVILALEKARVRLVATRPTATGLSRLLSRLLQKLRAERETDEPIFFTLYKWVEEWRDQYYARSVEMGKYGAGLIHDGAGILTMCFAELSFILCLLQAKSQGKKVSVYVPETRPYLQGAHLTAPCIHELGIPVTLITDNMPAFLMSEGRIHIYFTAVDLVTMDGHVVNKIGTFQSAVTARYHGIPYYAFSHSADPQKPDRASIAIERRNGDELKTFNKLPITLPEIEAYYPAFDITPPHLVSGIITSKGIIDPHKLRSYFSHGSEEEFGEEL